MPRDAEGDGNGAIPSPPPGRSSNTLADTLERHFIGCYDVPLKQITLTSFARPISEKGLESVMQSIRDKGWLPHAPPAVVVAREGLPNGEFTEDCIATAEYRVLDGNHRIGAAKRLFDGETAVSCCVHYMFDASAMRILGDCEYVHARICRC